MRIVFSILVLMIGSWLATAQSNPVYDSTINCPARCLRILLATVLIFDHVAHLLLNN